MSRVASVVLIVLLLTACKSKKEKKPGAENATFFPVPTYIRGELARLDSSIVTVTKVETRNGQTDTVPIRQNEVRNYAKDFLSLPDISSPDLKDDYEVTHLYDDLQQAFVFTYTTLEPHPVQQQNVTVEPEQNAAGKNDIKSVYTTLVQTNGNTAVKKILLWKAGKGFLITTLQQQPNAAEQIHTVQINWNGFDGQTIEK